MFLNFRLVGEGERFKMKLRDAEALRKLEDAEHRGGPVWFRAAHFPGALDHLPTQKPTGAGQIVKL